MKEIWKRTNYSNYLVSSKGQIKNIKTNKILKTSRRSCYLRVGLKNSKGEWRRFSVHRLVAKAFIRGFKYGLQVNHKNGNKHDNRIQNLEWVTPSQNSQHARYVLGIEPYFIRISKLNSHDIIKIRELYDADVSAKIISKQFGISETHTINIIHRRCWKHV